MEAEENSHHKPEAQASGTWDTEPPMRDSKANEEGQPKQKQLPVHAAAAEAEFEETQRMRMEDQEGAERGAKREALPQPEAELARPTKRTFIVAPDPQPPTEEQRCNAELKEENKQLQLQIQLLTEQVSNLLQKLDALTLQSVPQGQDRPTAKVQPPVMRSQQDQWSEYDMRTQQVVYMHRLGELALEAYEQAGQSMLLCRLHWDTVEREVYKQARRWHNPSSEGNLCLTMWRATLGQLPLETLQADQAEKVKLEICNHGAAHVETLVRSLGGNLEQMAGNFKRMLAPCELADENAL
eukprot:6478470-Amphidinium_carterae.1